MAAEFEKLRALADEIRARAQVNHPAWAEEAGRIAQQAGRSADLIRKLRGPEYFIEPEIPQNGELLGQKELYAEALAEFAEFIVGRLNTPERVTTTYQNIWRIRAKEIGMDIPVPEFPGSREDLQEHLAAGDMPFFNPGISIYLLGRMFPKMGDYAVKEGGLVTNEVDHSGWRYTESSTDAPYLNTTEEALRKEIEKKARKDQRIREGLTLSEYISASQGHKILTDKYFDQGGDPTSSRLLASRCNGYVVHARFYPAGGLWFGWILSPGARSSYVGGRSSEGVKKA